jgi:hypothetical protein
MCASTPQQFEAHFYSQGGGSGSGTASAVADVGLHLVYHFNREFVGIPSPIPEPSTLGSRPTPALFRAQERRWGVMLRSVVAGVLDVTARDMQVLETIVDQ